MNTLLKTCKICNIEQLRQGDFSGGALTCCKCMYAKKKLYFQKYYEKNAEKMKIYEREKYAGENKTRKIRKYDQKPVKNEDELKQM